MEIHPDDVYGAVKVSDGLLHDLVESDAVQRLKGVTQAGASSLVRSGRNVTRYEHSLGVMSLTGQLGGSESEQATGLLQDVSHTAFSHTIDYVFRDEKEEFHERIFSQVIERSDLPLILEKYGHTWQELFDQKNLSRVDVKAPLLCADRIDYTLRDLIRFGHIEASMARRFVAALAFLEGKVTVTDEEWAWKFVQWYTYLVTEVFMNPLELYVHEQLAELIRDALTREVITEADLLGTDEHVISKLVSGNEELAERLRRIRRARRVETGEHAAARWVSSKARTIDPPVLHNGSVVPLSEIRPEVSQSADLIRSRSSEGIFVRLVE